MCIPLFEPPDPRLQLERHPDHLPPTATAACWAPMQCTKSPKLEHRCRPPHDHSLHILCMLLYTPYEAAPKSVTSPSFGYCSPLRGSFKKSTSPLLNFSLQFVLFFLPFLCFFSLLCADSLLNHTSRERDKSSDYLLSAMDCERRRVAWILRPRPKGYCDAMDVMTHHTHHSCRDRLGEDSQNGSWYDCIAARAIAAKNHPIGGHSWRIEAYNTIYFSLHLQPRLLYIINNNNIDRLSTLSTFNCCDTK